MTLEINRPADSSAIGGPDDAVSVQTHCTQILPRVFPPVTRLYSFLSRSRTLQVRNLSLTLGVLRLNGG